MRNPYALAAALAVQPAYAEDARFAPGQVGCFGYDTNTETCAVIRTAISGGGDEHRIIIDRWGTSFADVDYRVTMAMRFSTFNGKYCASPVGAHSTVRRFDALDKQLMIGCVFGMMGAIKALDLICYEYTPCGDRVLASASNGKEADRAYTYLFRMFNPDDPVTKRLNVRMTDDDEKDAWLSDAVVKGSLPPGD